MDLSQPSTERRRSQRIIESLPLAVRVTLVAPDQDVTAVHGRVDVAVQGAGAHPLPPIAASLAERAFAALIEPLRGLGGQTSTTGLGVEVRCLVASF